MQLASSCSSANHREPIDFCCDSQAKTNSSITLLICLCMKKDKK